MRLTLRPPPPDGGIVPERRSLQEPLARLGILALVLAAGLPVAAQGANQGSTDQSPSAQTPADRDLARAAQIADPERRRELFGDDIDERLMEEGMEPVGGFEDEGEARSTPQRMSPPVEPRRAISTPTTRQGERSFVPPAEFQARQRANQEIAERLTDAQAQPELEEDTIAFDAFTEPVELTLLLSITAETLGINMTVDEALTGTVRFNAPVALQRDELLPFIDALLTDRGFTIVQNDTGWYTVRRTADIPLNALNANTTRIIRTLNVTPSAILPALVAQLSDANVRTTPLDELGVLVLTGPKRSLDAAEAFIEEILTERGRLKFERVPLQFISAPIALDRAVELLSGRGAGGLGARAIPNQPNQPNQPNIASTNNALANLSARLRIDPGDNALLFLGLPEELEEVREVIRLIDVASSLEPRRYRTGTATNNIAQIASAQGLGTVIELQPTSGSTGGFNTQQALQAARNQQPGFAANNQGSSSGGSQLIVDPSQGYIVYYGTPVQQEKLASLIDQFEVSDEVVTIRSYKLQHADAEEVETVLVALIRNQSPVGDDGGGFLLPQNQPGVQTNTPETPDVTPQQLAEGEIGGNFDDQSFVVADTANNQLFVKAPQRQQKEFARLIERLDQRRPQVFIEARIVTITVSDDFDFSVETNLFEVFGSNASISSNLNGGVGGNPFGTAPSISPGGGFTGVVLNSRQVPILVNAIATDSRARTVATPSLLVDDNEEASVQTISEEPTTTTSQGGDTTQTSFGGFEEAGTTLTVTPQISEGGYIRLNYDIEQSSFVGEGTDILPPGRLTNNINSDSVTVPSGSTVIIGGLNTDADNSTVVKIPLIGDIPLLGNLFRSTSKGKSRQRLYVFLTPRILTEPTVEDYRLLTSPALAESKIEGGEPTISPILIPVRVPQELKQLSLDDVLTEAKARELGLSRAPTAEQPAAAQPSNR